MIGLNEGVGEDARRISRVPELTAAIFGAGGWLEDRLRLEHRPQQEAMARAVARAFQDDEPLLFEAGTGVGKSLAYLIPGLLHSVDTGRPCVVSTHTISLQEQIQGQDLPRCRRLFSSAPELAAYADFKSALLIGKANYLCTSRLARALAEKSTLFGDSDYAELQRIAEWADKTETGIRHELQPPPSPEVWEAVSADGAACSRRNCGERCPYQRARSRLRSANVIVVNHALLFALIAAGGARAEGAGSGGRGVLFPDDFVVLDEAHTVPEVAGEHFGVSIGSTGVERLLKGLYNPKTRRGLMARRTGSDGAEAVVRALEASTRF
ncbi:MAG: ATP-dependent DNA helicase, partial [Opitutaceae bacterium]